MSIILKEKVINYLNMKLNDLSNTNDKYKLNNIDVRKKDLVGIIDLVCKYDFIYLENNCELANDMLFINPEGKDINGKIFYTNELLNYDTDVIAIKIVSELIFYFSGIWTFSQKSKMLSYLYLSLAHLTLLDFSIKYYAQNKRGKLYELFSLSDPDIINRYRLDFSKEKILYYESFSIKNSTSYISPLIQIAKHEFINGTILKCYKYSFHITAGHGIDFADRTTDYASYSQKSIYKISQYPRFDSWEDIRFYYLDSNGKLTNSRKIKNELNEQLILLEALV